MSEIAPSSLEAFPKRRSFFFAVALSLLLLLCRPCACSISSPSQQNHHMAAKADLSTKVVGIVGCGKIGSAIGKGYASLPCGASERPLRILVSPRSADKAAALAAEFPDIVTVASTNEEVVAGSDIVYIGLLPPIARETLPLMPFKEGHLVISTMAAVDIQEVVSLTRMPADRVVRTVPLPSCARQSGPILTHPPNADAEAVLNIIGSSVVCAKESDMKPLVCQTGHISSFYELMRVSQDFFIKEGVDAAVARTYVSSFYASLAEVCALNYSHTHTYTHTHTHMNKHTHRPQCSPKNRCTKCAKRPALREASMNRP